MSPNVDPPPLHARVEELRADDVQRDMEVWNRSPPKKGQVPHDLHEPHKFLHEDLEHKKHSVQYDRFSAWVDYRATRSRVGGSPFVDLRDNRARYTESSVQPDPNGVFPTRGGPPVRHYSARQTDALLAESRAFLDEPDRAARERPKIWTQEKHDAFLVAHEEQVKASEEFIKAFEAKLAARNAAASSGTANVTVESGTAAVSRPAEDSAAAEDQPGCSPHSIAQQKQYQAGMKLDEHAQTLGGENQELDELQGIVEDSMHMPAQAEDQLDEQSQSSEGLQNASEESVEQHTTADGQLGEHIQTLQGKDEEIERLQKLVNELRSRQAQAENQLVEQTRAMRSQDEKLKQLQNRCEELEAIHAQASKKLTEQDKELKKLGGELSAAFSLKHKSELEIELEKLDKINDQAQTDRENRHSDKVTEPDARDQSLSGELDGETELKDVSR